MFEKRTVLLAVVALVAAACGEPGNSADTAAPAPTSSTTTPLETTMPQVPSSNPNTAPETVTDKAVLDLAARLKVSEDSVIVVAAEAVTWPDGSLGCPQPGMFYTQALVDGSRVLLEVDGRTYVYHAGRDGEPFLCESDEGDGGYDFAPPPGFDE
jgi:hypothetical protein